MEKRESQGNMYTLKELLDEYVFIIPDYQRDYAQGRSNPRDEHVLALFVEEISKALLSGNHLYLDYVYGDIEERNGVEFFYPVDGQQRLTTLFLFYIHCYQTVKDETEKAFLGKLRYDIRTTSNKLISGLIKDGFKEPDSNSPAWTQWVNLYSEISKDPTAVALLRAYRKIEKVLGEGKQKEYKEQLEKITFEVVDTKKHSLPKTVFWKMNARGRALTQSEIFKAAFFSEDESAKNFDGFVEKLFCLTSSAGCDYQVFEKTLMNIVNIIFEGFKEIRYPANSHEGFDFWRATYISKDEYLDYQSERKDEINQIFSALQKIDDPFEVFDKSLPKYVKRQRDGGILNCLVNNSGLTQNVRALFFSYLIALPINSESLKEWMRVCANLIWNSSDVAYALKIIYKLKGNASSILEFLSRDKEVESELSTEIEEEIETNLRQYQEERTKAFAIVNNKIKKDDVEKAENTAFADGRIDFLFYDAEGKKDWKNFKIRRNNFDCMFDENGVKENHCVAVAKAYIKLSNFCWGQNYFFDKSKNYWKNKIFAKINVDANRRIIGRLLSVTSEVELNKIEIEEKDTFFLSVKNSLIENEWFIKWMFKRNNNEVAKYSIKWPNMYPCFHKWHCNNVIYWDVRGWSADEEGRHVIENKLNTFFFIEMYESGVSLDEGYYSLIDDDGNESDSIDFSSFHLVIFGEWYNGVNYTRFKYNNNNTFYTFYLISTGKIITASEYSNNEWDKIGEERSIYCLNDKQEWVLKSKENLTNILQCICRK